MMPQIPFLIGSSPSFTKFYDFRILEFKRYFRVASTALKRRFLLAGKPADDGVILYFLLALA